MLPGNKNDSNESDDTAAEIVVKNPQARQGYTLEDIGRLRSNYHCDFIFDKSGNVKEMDKASLEGLEELIILCKANNVIPIMVTTPFMSYYNDGFPDEMYQVFYEQISMLEKEYSISYWDYSHHELFVDSPNLFLDTDHLNEKGAKVFADTLLTRLRNEMDIN